MEEIDDQIINNSAKIYSNGNGSFNEISPLNSRKEEEYGQLANNDSRDHPNTNTFPNENPRVIMECTCPHCGKWFLYANELLLHLQTHFNEKPYTCTKCSKGFSNIFSLVCHGKLHAKDRRQKCGKCEKEFITSKCLVVHERSHSGRKVFSCKVCGVSFSLSSSLFLHAKAHQNSVITNELKANVSEGTDNSIELASRGTEGIKKKILNRYKRNLSSHEFPPEGDNDSDIDFEQSPVDTECEMQSGEFSSTQNRDSEDNSQNNETILSEIPDGDTSLRRLRSRRHECSICGHIFKYASHLHAHAIMHTGVKKHACPECGKCFGWKGHLKVHLMGHSGHKPRQCPHCNKAFTTGSTLRAHIRIHTNERPYVCEVCNKSFIQINSLNNHFKKYHPRQNRTSTRITRSSYKKTNPPIEEDLNEQTDGADAENEGTCSTPTPQNVSQLCDVDLLSSAETQAEVMKPDATPYQCKFCEKFFKLAIALRRHELMHSGVKNHKCPVCGKVFGKKGHLQVHLMGHRGERPYQCPHCEKRFTTGSALRTHVRIHTGERPYVCEICNKDFIQQNGLIDHFQRKHPGIKRTKSRLPLTPTPRGWGRVPEKAQAVEKECNNSQSERTKEANVETEDDLSTASKRTSETSSTQIDQFPFPEIATDLLDINKPFNCLTCGKGFRFASALRHHEVMHTGERKHICPECGKAFGWKGHLEVHLMGHRGDLPFSCPECSKGFRTGSALRTHLRTHTGEKPYECEICSQAFVQINGLVSHFRRKHPNHQRTKSRLPPSKLAPPLVVQRLERRVKKKHVCKECGLDAKSAENLERHITKTHAILPMFLCSDCGKSYPTSRALIEHRRSHTGELNFLCSVCGKRFTRYAALDLHLKIHSKDKPHLCPKCPKRFAVGGNLRKHMIVHSDQKPFQCSECGKTFGHRTSLTRHSISHSGEKRFMCNVCGKQLMSSQSLTAHLSKMHNIDRAPLTCTVCGKQFTYITNLEKHMEVDHGDGAVKTTHFVCEKCNKVFTNSNSLGKHVRKQHCENSAKKGCLQDLLTRPVPAVEPSMVLSYQSAEQIISGAQWAYL